MKTNTNTRTTKTMFASAIAHLMHASARWRGIWLPLVAAMFVALPARAAIVDAEVVSESGITNMMFSGTLGTIDGDGDGLEDDLEIVQVTFTIDRDEQVTIDSEAQGFDSYMYLFDDEGTLLEENDDTPFYHADSYFDTDSYIARDLTAGTYMVTLGALGSSSSDALMGYDANTVYSNRNLPNTNEAFGNWSLTISTPATAVPVPASLPLLGSALMVLFGMTRRR